MRKEAEVFLNYCWIHGPSPLVGNSLTSRWSMTQSIGPPSLAQGTRIAVGFSTSISRFIPACGELSKPSWAIVQLDGSSPLARGTRMNVKKLLSTRRFIPAYAGNSALACSRRARRSVHPRLRGELILVLRPALIHIGSSPLTRGTLILRKFRRSWWRFIPAYAGNSVWRFSDYN